MLTPIVSIILPTYKEAQFIASSIDSVLQQSFADWELIIVDDGLVAEAKERVKKYIELDPRIIYLENEKNVGIQKSLNRGLREAKGKYIARIDDDDQWIDKNKLQKQFEFLEKNQEYVLVGTGVVVIDENQKELFRYKNPKSDKELRKVILSKNCFTHSSVMFKKDAALMLGGYSESTAVLHLEDYDLWLKMGRVGKFYNFEEYMTVFMYRKTSLSSQNKLKQLKLDLLLIKEYKEVYPSYFISRLKIRIKIFLVLIFKKVLPFDFMLRFKSF